VLANHAPDIVMFDVPPPEQGVRGIDAYRDSWPGFFEWQSSGAVFEIESLDVTAGAEVAFAFALLRCGTPADFERDPEQRLRLTIGLSKVDDRWGGPTNTTRSQTRPGRPKNRASRAGRPHHPVHLHRRQR
jgi:ketosteroid isomerase-like protein